MTKPVIRVLESLTQRIRKWLGGIEGNEAGGIEGNEADCNTEHLESHQDERSDVTHFHSSVGDDIEQEEQGKPEEICILKQ